MGNVTSTLDIVLKDDVSRNAAAIAASLKKMEAEAKAVDGALARSGTSDKLQASLKRIGAEAPHIEAVAKAWKDYAKAQNLAADRSHWTKDEIAGVKSWESVKVASLRSVMNLERAHAEQQRKFAAEQARVYEQQRHASERQGFGHYVLSGAAMAVSAHGIMRGVEYSAEKGAEYQKELVGLQNAGRTPEEIKAIQKAALSTIGDVPTSTLIENMKTIAETTTAFGSVEHAMEHLAFLQKANSVLHAAGGDKIQGGPAEVGQALAKYYEERMRGPEDFEKEVSAMIPAMVASGGNFNPEKLYAFAQQAKAALPGYDLDFLSKYAPSLIAANGGDRAGTAANAFDSVISGKARDKRQAAEWMRLGLLDPKEAIEGKGGPIGWKAGAVKDTDLAMRNPVEWAKQVLIPAMQAKGVNVDDRLSVKKELATLFRNQNANFWANEITQAQSRKRLEKDAELYDKAGKLADIYWRNLQKNPEIAIAALKGSVENLMGAVSTPAMPAAAYALSGVAQAVNQIAVAAKNHPAAAISAGALAAGGALYGAGKLGYNLLNGGFGLKTSAHALDVSAIELKGAAHALRGAAMAEHAHGGGGRPGGGFGGGAGEHEPHLNGSGKSPPLDKMYGRWALLGANMLPFMLNAVDDYASTPEELKTRIKQQSDDADQVAAYWTKVVRKLRTDLHLSWLHFKDDGEIAGSSDNRPADADDRMAARGQGNHYDRPAFPHTVTSEAPIGDGLNDPNGPQLGGAAPMPAAHDNGAPYRDPASLQPVPEAPKITPQIDLDPAMQGLMQLMSLTDGASQKMTSALNVTASPQVNTGAILNLLALIAQAEAGLARLGSGGGGPARPGPTIASRARGSFSGDHSSRNA